MLFKSSLLVFLTLAAGISASPLEIETRDSDLSWCPQCTSSPNNCDITAPCSNFLGKQYCGWYYTSPAPLPRSRSWFTNPSNSRPGYRASNIPILSPKQWRIDTIPGQDFRVWVAPGVVCDKPCAHAFGATPCAEVPIRDQCSPIEYHITVNPSIVSNTASPLYVVCILSFLDFFF